MSLADDVALARHWGSSVSVVRRVELVNPQALRDLLLRLVLRVERQRIALEEIVESETRWRSDCECYAASAPLKIAQTALEDP